MSYGIETRCAALTNMVTGIGPDADVASRMFAEHGLVAAAGDWLPVHQVLAILRRLGDELGDDTLFRIGESVPLLSNFPANLDTVGRALRSLDIAYHMNHRRNGSVMFDAESGLLAEGIGCYVCSDDASGTFIVSSASLYPCPFDMGLISALARRFEPWAEVEHLDNARCRRHGTAMCTYAVSW